MPPKHQVHFITGNKNKLAITQAFLGDDVEVRGQALNLVEIQGTIEEISMDKCRRAADAVNGPVLVEDTSLCFNALKGLPGPYIKWFLDELGCEGLYNLLAAYSDKTAEAVSTYSYSKGPGHTPMVFQGRMTGKIVPPRGLTGFGWDPIFEYQGQTFAEIDGEEKNKITYRFQALQKFKKWLESSVE